MRKLTLEQWQTLAQGLHREVARVAPEWTDHNTHDPGVTVLELLTYALEDLHARKNSLDERAHVLIRQVAEHARTLTEAGTADDCPPGLQRVNYFTGALLGAEDFTAEQDYVRSKLARRNRLLHGAGVVSGLQVSVERNGGTAQVVIAPGFALDPFGEEIEVRAPANLPLPAQGKTLLVLLRYAEQPCRPVAAITGAEAAATGAADVQHARIVETFSATLSPGADPGAITLARLNRARGRWTRDTKFRPARVRR